VVGIVVTEMAMAAMAPARASASIASCQVVHKPPAVKDARVAKMSALSSSMNGVLARDSAGRREASGSRGQVRCALAGEVHTRDQDDVRTYKGFERPDSFGRYGVYGGKYVPETLMAALSNLEVSGQNRSITLFSESSTFVLSPLHGCEGGSANGALFGSNRRS
jgi:hypothetical protein